MTLPALVSDHYGSYTEAWFLEEWVVSYLVLSFLLLPDPVTVENYAAEATTSIEVATSANEFIFAAIEVCHCNHIVCIRNMVSIHSQSWPLIDSSNVCVKLLQSETLKIN